VCDDLGNGPCTKHPVALRQQQRTPELVVVGAASRATSYPLRRHSARGDDDPAVRILTLGPGAHAVDGG
jgi:hypothetical protein